MAPDDPVLHDHERRLTRLEEARRGFDETLIVIGEIERRQSALLKEHSELIVAHERKMVQVDNILVGIGEKLSEMTDKLNGLIGWAEGSIKPKPPSETNGPPV